jgi:hypothetical protein
MSTLLRCLNSIKRERTEAWLTPSQRTAMAQVTQLLQLPGHVNLFGAIGVGKTFLAWFVADQLGYLYLPHPTMLAESDRPTPAGIVIDNCSSQRSVHRELLKELSFCGISRSLLVTRTMLQDYSHFVQLTLTDEDQIQVRLNVARIGCVLAPENTGNLWSLINSRD